MANNVEFWDFTKTKKFGKKKVYFSCQIFIDKIQILIYKNTSGVVPGYYIPPLWGYILRLDRQLLKTINFYTASDSIALTLTNQG